ncbi:DUF6544 family protein [Enterococcus raffinosus]|uniref:DUF6544 family protein n=1 Tax=Enterococcus raffinosus TaxID=71452 RepID=UPI00209CD36B|nr:DUF6544 family protein [Enterococcus raffinosus]
MMLVWGFIIVLVLVIIYLIIPGGPAWKKYVADVASSFQQEENNSSQSGLITEEAIADLPQPLKKYLKKNGYVNQPMMRNMYIRFENTKFRMEAGKNPIPIDFCQVNFVGRPDRYAFLKVRMFGLPVQVRDSVQDGKGSMIGVLAKHFQLFHSTGPEMDQSQLITALADAVFMPSLFLQEYITWKTIDQRRVEGTISWKGVSVKGRFTFDDSGDIVRFDTDERYMDENGKGTSLVPWFVLYENYQSDEKYRRPGCVSVNWQLLQGVDNYFVSDRIKVQYSIEPSELHKEGDSKVSPIRAS